MGNHRNGNKLVVAWALVLTQDMLALGPMQQLIHAQQLRWLRGIDASLNSLEIKIPDPCILL